MGQILATIKSSQRQSEDLLGLYSLIDRIEKLEAKERLAIECISLKVKIGISALHNNRKADHQHVISTAEKLISEVSSIKSDLQAIISDKSS